MKQNSLYILALICGVMLLHFNVSAQSCSGFKNYPQGDWGTDCKAAGGVGCTRDQNFSSVFPTGLTIGCTGGKQVIFNSSSAVNAFLPAGGSPGKFPTTAPTLTINP